MLPTELRYRQVHGIRDESFHVDQLHNYILSIVLGKCDFQVSVLDTTSGKLISCEDYIFNKQCPLREQLPLLEHLFEGHPFLGAGFWKRVHVTVKNELFAHVPASLFDVEHASEYLKMNARINGQQVLHCHSNPCELVTVFAVGTEIVAWFKDKYPNCSVRFLHQIAGLIDGVHAEAVQRTTSPLYLYVDRFKLHILFMRAGKLIYYNQFPIQQFADYIKYTMLVVQMLRIDAKNAHIILWGYMGKKSPHLAALSKYLRNVSLGGRPDHLKFGYKFDELEDHQLFDLYSMYRLSD